MVVRENLGMINTHPSMSMLKQHTQGTGEECRAGMLWAETLCCQVRSPGVVFSQDSWQPDDTDARRARLCRVGFGLPELNGRLTTPTVSGYRFGPARGLLRAGRSNEDADGIHFVVSRAWIPIRPSRSPEFQFLPPAPPAPF